MRTASIFFLVLMIVAFVLSLFYTDGTSLTPWIYYIMAAFAFGAASKWCLDQVD